MENYELHKKADSAGSSADSSEQVAQLQSELAEKIAFIETKEAEKAELQKVGIVITNSAQLVLCICSIVVLFTLLLFTLWRLSGL